MLVCIRMLADPSHMCALVTFGILLVGGGGVGWGGVGREIFAH